MFDCRIVFGDRIDSYYSVKVRTKLSSTNDVVMIENQF